MEPKPIERRCFAVQELRAETEGEKRVIRGHAAVFDSWSETMYDPKYGAFRERISPGAFTETLARGDDVYAFMNHDENLIIGRTLNGSLTLSEDERGLMATLVPPDTQAGRDAITLVETGYLREWSFAFFLPGVDDQHVDFSKSPRERTLSRLRLRDVSIVADPAYPEANDATVTTRSLDLWVEAQPKPKPIGYRLGAARMACIEWL